MEYSWKNDPRLKDMDPKKLEYLTAFSEKVKKTPKNQLLSIFLTLNTEASQKGIHFSDQETELWFPFSLPIFPRPKRNAWTP